MRSFRDIPIRQKLTLLIMLTSSIGLLLAGVAIISYEKITYEQRITEDLSALARIIGAQSTAALAFNDPNAARENLAALKAKPEIVTACIYKQDGKLFAKYVRSKSEDVALPPQAKKEGLHFKAGFLGLSQKIVQDGEVVGSVYLRSDLSPMRAHLTSYIIIVVAVIAGLMMVILLLSGVLQRTISNPLLGLARVAHVVSI
jgi:uncharacterized membrane protein affecting hemolysin expression